MVVRRSHSGSGRHRSLSAWLSDALRTIDRDAAVDGIVPVWSRAITLLPIAGIVVLGVIYAVHVRLFYWLLLEDHAIEWGQFSLLVFTVVLALCAALRHQRRGLLGLTTLMVLVALCSLVLAGEEISWGQRVFSLVPRSSLSAVNRQQELNLHNVNVNGISVNRISDIIKLLMGVGGAALALLTRPVRARFHSTWLWRVAPPLAAIPGFALIAIYHAFMMGTRTGVAPALVYQEWMELGLYLSIAITVACCYTRASGTREQTVTPAAVRRGRGWSTKVLMAGTAVAAIAITIVFAEMSAASGILPGNVPPSMEELYREF